jgi:hypothetical protein
MNQRQTKSYNIALEAFDALVIFASAAALAGL